MGLLTTIILIPLLAVFVIVLLPDRQKQAIKWVALAATGIDL